MPVITVMYPSDSGTKFDLDYYMNTHIPLVKQRWATLGMSDLTVLRGTPGPDGAAPAYSTIAVLTFDSMEHFHRAAQAHGKEIFGDIPNFTDATPITQFNNKAS